MAERTSSPAKAKSTERGGIGSTSATAGRSETAGIGGQTAPEGSLGSDSGSLSERVRERASAQLNTQKDRATEGLGTMAQAVRQSTHQLREQHHETVASYIEQAADQIDRLSQNLKNKDVGELVSDAQRMARRRPALFVGSAFAVGLAGARFFKSSPPDDVRPYGSDRERGGTFRSYAAEGSIATRTSGAPSSSSLSPDYPGSER
jgi:hypothetical protein